MAEPGVALVTGAARGIGAAITRRLLAGGWQVIALDLAGDLPGIPYALAGPAELKELVDLGAESVVGDCRDPAVIGTAVARAEELGGLSAVIAAAGVIGGGVPLWEQDPDQVRTVLEVDLSAVITLAQLTLAPMVARGTGRFVAIASSAATTGLPLLAAYCAAKAGVTGLIRALAAELGPTGVTANTVSPGSTDTAILAESARLYGLGSAAQFARQQPLGRLVRAEEVAAAVAYLLSPEAAAVLGAELKVDAGLSL